jgi:hypothetical protein
LCALCKWLTDCSLWQGDVVLFVAPEAKSDDELMQRLRYTLLALMIATRSAGPSIKILLWTCAVDVVATTASLLSLTAGRLLGDRFYNVTAVVVEAKFPYFEQGSFPRMMIEALLLPPMPELKAMNRR